MKHTLFVAIIMFILIMFITTPSYPFDIKIHNNTDTKMTYNLIWIDCDWYGPEMPASMAAGEIEPNILNDMEVDYAAGDYAVIWNNYKTGEEVSRFRIQIPYSHGILTSQPESLIFRPGA